jgi:ABC-type multidrug transport system fused ATPase/permease subunit
MPRTTPLTRETFYGGAKVIARVLRPHKKILVLLTTFGLIDAAAQAFVPLVSGKIFDAIIAIAEHATVVLTPVLTLIAVWLVLQLTSNATSWWTGFHNDRLSTLVGSEYVAMGLGKLFEMPLSFHATGKHGDMSDRIMRASNWLDNIIGNVLLTLLPNFLSIVIALIITLFINWTLTCVLLVAIAIYATILWRAVPYLVVLQQKQHRAYNRAYGDASDALENIREIKQATTEKAEQKKAHRNFVDRAVRFWVDMNTIAARLTFSQRIVVTLTQLSIFVISVFYVQNGTITPGELVAFNGYAAMMLGPFVILGQNWQTVQNGMVAIVRAEKTLSTPTEIYEPEGGISPKKLRGEVAFRDVHFAYKGGNKILKGVSFRAQPGERIALVGDSGVGKTTIVDLIAGFYFPDHGKILVDGTDIRKMNLTVYRSHIGAVPQEPTLFNDTVEANIRYGSRSRSRAAMIEAAKKAHAHSFIEGFPKKYRQLVGWRGIKLSTGQKQRIALARAFLRNPDILILDEPTSALDARSEYLIKESLRELMKGRTTFIIAHRLSTVREADKILVLKGGVIAEEGTHGELMKLRGGTYRMLYELQRGFTA